MELAIRLRLRGADAVYVALAEQLGIPIVTWDGEMLKSDGRSYSGSNTLRYFDLIFSPGNSGLVVENGA